jgi:2'-5' RNA ligase
LNKQLSKKYRTHFTSEFLNYSPHITIYQAEFPNKNKAKVLRMIKSLVANSEEVLFVPSVVDIKRRYVAFTFKKDRDIGHFHKQLVEGLNLFREGQIKDVYSNSMQNFTQAERNNIKKWGYPYVMKLYNPHLTILELEDEKDTPKVSKTVSWNKSFLVNTVRVIVSNKDKNGDKTRTIHDYILNAKV